MHTSLSYQWKQGLISTVVAQGYSHALTIAWNRDIGIDRAWRNIKLLHAKTDKKLLGRNYWKFDPSERTRAIFVFEGIGYNLHVHSFWKIEPKHLIKFNRLFSGEHGGLWNTIVSSGSYKLDMMMPGERGRFASYMLKTQHADADAAQIFWSEDFLRAA